MLSNQTRSPDPTEPKTAAAPSRAAEPVLDAAALARLGELDPRGENRLIERILKTFQTSVARLRPQLETARQGHDLPAIRHVVHTLKSSSGSIGALGLSQLCAQIESAIRLEATQDLNASLADFDLALDSVLQAIDALLKERA